MKVRKFNIKKGNHYSGLHLGINYNKKSFKIEVVFSESCAYESFGDEDDYDINKLYGISWGYHHLNSYRIGWRPDYNGNIILSNYYYVDGERKYNDICTVRTNDIIKIKFDKGHISVTNNTKNWTSVVSLNMSNKCGYTLYPYFGGNKTAPNDMEILIIR